MVYSNIINMYKEKCRDIKERYTIGIIQTRLLGAIDAQQKYCGVFNLGQHVYGSNGAIN